jgi:hypothetical protein
LLHRFAHPSPQFLERDVSYTGLDSDEIGPRRYMRHDFSSDLTKAAPISIAFRRLPHPARHGIGDPAGLVGRQGWVVVYPDWTRVSASPGAAEGGKRCPSAQPLQPDIGRCSFLVHQIAETARVLHPRLALRRSGRQPGTTAPPARLQHRLAGAGRHSVPEAVLPGTLPGVRLEGAFHLALFFGSSNCERTQDTQRGSAAWRFRLLNHMDAAN